MVLFKHNITNKRRVYKKTLSKPEKKLEFESGDNKGYEIDGIIDSVYTTNRQTTKCRAFIILFYGKATSKKKILKNFHQQSYSSGS